MYSKNKLLKLLNDIIENIQKDEVSQEDQEQLWDFLTWNKEDTENKKLLNYLSLGYWISYFYQN